jgi:hypothetical protein
VACTALSPPHLLLQIDSWGDFSVFRVAELSGNQPLVVVGLAVLQRLGLVEKLELPLLELTNFLRVRVRGAAGAEAQADFTSVSEAESESEAERRRHRVHVMQDECGAWTVRESCGRESTPAQCPACTCTHHLGECMCVGTEDSR